MNIWTVLTSTYNTCFALIENLELAKKKHFIISNHFTFIYERIE